MNEELLKQLYDAKFPLHVASMEDGKDSKRKYQIFYYGKDSYDRPGTWLYPTLEELIEALGNEANFVLLKVGDKWQAGQGPSPLNGVVSPSSATPTEAVAKLWLALQQQP